MGERMGRMRYAIERYCRLSKERALGWGSALLAFDWILGNVDPVSRTPWQGHAGGKGKQVEASRRFRAGRKGVWSKADERGCGVWVVYN